MGSHWRFQGKHETVTRPAQRFFVEQVEYATWTPTDFDDQIAKMIRSILADHRDILETMIDRIRIGEELSAPELSAMLETVSISDKYGSPMMVLYILSIVYHALQFMKMLDTDKTPPKPDREPPILPPTPKRPVMNFIRTIFKKELGERMLHS